MRGPKPKNGNISETEERPKSKLPIVRQKPAQPTYIRLPPPRGRCPYTGLSRSGLADICVPNKSNNFRPPVRSIFLRKGEFAKHGVRLIDFSSLMNYLGRQFAKQSSPS
jgi:hypothetical protein